VGWRATCPKQGVSVVKLLRYVNYHSSLYSPCSVSCIYPEGEISRVRMRKGVTSFRDDWASMEVPDLTEHPLNLALYMSVRIFVYSSNILMTSFE
jgi:hypothetical protein